MGEQTETSRPSDIEISDRLRANAAARALPRRQSRLEKAARTLLAKAEASLGADRKTNTRKRAEEARIASRRALRDGIRARMALAICENPNALGVPISSLKDLEALELEVARSYTQWVPEEDRNHDTDHAAVDGLQKAFGRDGTLAHVSTNEERREVLLAFIALRRACDVVFEDPVRALERQLVGFTAPGYFPTPKPLARRMAELLDCRGMIVLEPSAGSGRLADAARQADATDVVCVEPNPTLVSILKAKGYQTFASTLEAWIPVAPPTFDRWSRIIANFPFEDGLDAEHMQIAYGLLESGGILVCITGEGIWFRENKQCQEFREWFAGLDCFHNEKLPAGTFNASDVTQRTGVASRLLAVSKP